MRRTRLISLLISADCHDHGLVVEFSHFSAFLDQGMHQLCPPVRGLGAWMLPSDPEADRTGDRRVALPDPCHAARNPLQQLSKYFFQEYMGLLSPGDAFFFSILKHPGVPRGIIDCKIRSSLTLHRGLLAWILINHALIHGKQGFSLKPSPSCCSVLSSSEVLPQLWVCLHAKVIFPCVFHLLPQCIIKFN